MVGLAGAAARLAVTGRERTVRRAAIVACAGLVAALVPFASGIAGAQTAPATGRKAGANVSDRLEELAAGSAVARTTRAENRSVDLPSSGAGSLLRHDDGSFLVNARLTSVDATTEAALVRAGASVVALSVPDHLVTLAIDATAIEPVAAVEGVEWLEEVLTPTIGQADLSGLGQALQQDGVGTNAVCGSQIVSEGDTHLGAAAARTTYGVDGTGIKIGVLSDSYNNLGGASADVTNGELPGTDNPCGRTTPVVVQSDKAGGGTDEGRAMAQAVHDLAPGATIMVATAFNGDVDFAQQIRDLAAAGAKVIVDDVSYFNEPVYQDGIIANAIADVTADGVTYFSSAANSNLILAGLDVASYEAPSYRPATCPGTLASVYGISDCHDWNPAGGTDAGNVITIANGGKLQVKLGYNEPSYGIVTDLDLFLVDNATNTVLAASASDNVGQSQQAYELLSYTNATGATRDTRLVVGRYNSATTPRLKLVDQTTSGVTAVQWNASSGGDVVGPTSYGHNMMRTAGSVAAIRYSTTTAPESFSSRGPATYCWGPVVGVTAAAALPSCQTDTIDIAATDGAANSFFGQVGSGVWRFFGTSQAAPHAAAVAVLQLAARPCRTPAEILAAQRSSGLAIGSYGVDAVGGGRLDASAAISSLAACQAVPDAWTPFASWTAMVDRIYVDMLGRAPTASERSSRVAQLSAGTLTPGGLVAALRFDSDNVTNVDPVTRLYRAYFLRIPDPSGLTYWIRQRRVNNKKLNAISDSFATSNEFKTKYGSLTNKAFVQLVYQNVLGRTGEASGVTYWTSRLDRKVSTRGQVMTGFSESNEYKTKQVSEVDVSVLFILNTGKAPTASVFDTLVAALDDESTTPTIIAQDIIDSAAYATRVGG